MAQARELEQTGLEVYSRGILDAHPATAPGHIGPAVEQVTQEARDPKARRRALWHDINIAWAGKPKSLIEKVYREQRALIGMSWPEAHDETSEEPQQDVQPTHTETTVPPSEPVRPSTTRVVPEHSGIIFDPAALKVSQGFVYRRVNGSWKPILSGSKEIA